MSERTAGRYHDAPYTLDEKTDLPDEVDEQTLSSGHDEPDAEAVRERIEEHKETAKAEREAADERDREFAERDPKPKPSEMLAESGREPAPDSDDDQEQDASSSQGEQDTASNGSEVPNGTTQEVLDWVGDDKARAQSALDAENAKSSPRSTLVSELEKRSC
jgi:hypothetical protein